MSDVVTRFAPSPTGHLHLGHAYSALLAAGTAKQSGGRFLLRIEDIDQGRCRPEFVDAIFEDLAWLGLQWEEPVRTQSAHFDDYARYLSRLTERNLVYPCFCTRKEILAEVERAGAAPHGPEGTVYPGICRNLSAGEREARIDSGQPHALRLNMERALAMISQLEWTDIDAGPQTAEPEPFGDIVLARKDTPSSYHLAVSVDDHIQCISLVVRGVDLFEATHVHRLLQELLNLKTPTYRHHGLLTDDSGRRFAKRDKALTIRDLRNAGHSADAVRAMTGIEG